MRSGFSHLHALVSNEMKSDLFAGNLFLFLGKNKRRAKILLFDGSGLMLIVKRLDRGNFMRVEDLMDTPEIEISDLKRLLDGVNLKVVFTHKKQIQNLNAFS